MHVLKTFILTNKNSQTETADQDDQVSICNLTYFKSSFTSEVFETESFLCFSSLKRFSF